MDSEADSYFDRATDRAAEQRRLRAILLDCGLGEALRWGKPCYRHGDSNVVILQKMNDFLALLFFKGAVLNDPEGLLESQGPNTRLALRVTFRDMADIEAKQAALRALVQDAIASEGEDRPPPPRPAPGDDWPEELHDALDEDPDLKAAFDALTPGRQRGYALHFAAPKKSETRRARIEKCAPMILDGRGLHD